MVAEMSNSGKIVTFYSFKGGVGRTMSLANVAYLAAHAGKRVLVMDWDLEAPGLGYYFRGLTSPEKYEPIKQARGVLDILWDWHHAVSTATGVPDLEAFVDGYRKGAPFADKVHSIVDPEAMAFAGELHFMSAGSPTINTPQPTAYAEALSMFPWPQFFTESVGGALIDVWREWAKHRYDLILIDSRTGLADVAGVCTMLFPDEVTLCFVLNRQNIDGTARVAASIRGRRGGDIALRAAPMRVAWGDTAEEDDARANAIKQLTRVGGFASDEVQHNFTQLQIRAAQGVPFYETLAPFAASDAELDPLTLNFCQMASAIIGEKIAPPKVTEHFRQQVRRRQDPRSATVDYVAKLGASEPARAVQELLSLVESAQVALHDDDFPTSNYAQALIDASFDINDADLEGEIISLKESLRLLFRQLYSRDPAVWRRLYIYFLERALIHTRFNSAEGGSNELQLLEKIDSLLAEHDDKDSLLKRITYRRRAAQTTYLNQSDLEHATQLANEVLALAERIEKLGLSDEERMSVVAAKIDAHMLLGDLCLNSKQTALAYEHYLACLSFASSGSDTQKAELRRITALVHVRIASRFDTSLISPVTAARHALLAVEANPALASSTFRLTQLARAVSHPDIETSFARNLIERIFEPGGLHRPAFAIPGIGGLRLPTLVSLLLALTELVRKVSTNGVPIFSLRRVSDTAARALHMARNRSLFTSDYRMHELEGAAYGLCEALASCSALTDDLQEEAAALTSRAKRDAIDEDPSE